MIVLDATVANVALPSIQRDLGFPLVQPGLGRQRLPDRVRRPAAAGRAARRPVGRGVFLAGLGVFTAASLLCGLAQSQDMLVAARFLQGVGGR